MNHKRYFTFLIFLLLFTHLSFAQQKKDTIPTSTQYLFPEFTEGDVLMKDGTTAHVKLNYDAVWDQMQFKGADNVIMTIANPENVIKIEVAKRTFVYVKNYFAEMITSGPVMLFARIHQQRIVKKSSGYGGTSTTMSVQSVNSFTGGDRTNSELIHNDAVSFSKDVTYYLMVKGKMRVISSLNDLVKSFPSQKELVQKELENENTKYSSIESVKKFIDWVNTNGIGK